MNVKELLFILSNISGVSGDEGGVTATLQHFMSGYTENCRVLQGNVIADFGERTEGKPHVLVDAHIDEVGMICSYIDGDGFIVPANVGGLDCRLLPAQKVIVHGKKDIEGVVSVIPPHLTTKKSAVTDITNIRIDTGQSKAELADIVPLGSTISFDVECTALMNGRITGKTLDNRAGAVALIKMIDMLKDKELPCSLSVLFSATEEIGGRGARIACYDINPDIAIAVDASFAMTSDEKEFRCGKLGGGPMIGVSPSLSKEISDLLIETAKKKNIPYQIEVLSGRTGTNADQFSICRSGVKSCTCSIPIKYMHTPVELADMADIENTALLLAEFIRMVK